MAFEISVFLGTHRYYVMMEVIHIQFNLIVNSVKYFTNDK